MESQPTPASSKTLPSEQDAELAIYALQAKAWGVYRPGMDATEIRAAVNAERARQENARAEEKRALAEAAEDGRRKAWAASIAKKREALETSGFPTAGMDDAGVVAQFDIMAAEQQAKAEANRLQALRRRRAESLFSASGCPPRHVRHLDDAGECPAWTTVRDGLVTRLSDGEGYLVPLLGKRGTGKTQLAVSVVHRACLLGQTARYIKALDLFRLIRGAFTPVKRGEGGESESDVIDVLAGYGFLVIDELHQRAETQFEQNTLINLLDRRYDSMGYTILIANQGRKEFGDAMGESVKSRIHETGEPIECNWDSFRQPGTWKLGGAA